VDTGHEETRVLCYNSGDRPPCLDHSATSLPPDIGGNRGAGYEGERGPLALLVMARLVAPPLLVHEVHDCLVGIAVWRDVHGFATYDTIVVDLVVLLALSVSVIVPMVVVDLELGGRTAVDRRSGSVHLPHQP